MNHSIMSNMADRIAVPGGSGGLLRGSRGVGEMGGYTMKHFEEELVKLRNENFNLKLRIHLLEERQGLVARPEDRENVFR